MTKGHTQRRCFSDTAPMTRLRSVCRVCAHDKSSTQRRCFSHTAPMTRLRPMCRCCIHDDNNTRSDPCRGFRLPGPPRGLTGRLPVRPPKRISDSGTSPGASPGGLRRDPLSRIPASGASPGPSREGSGATPAENPRLLQPPPHPGKMKNMKNPWLLMIFNASGTSVAAGAGSRKGEPNFKNPN